ncbi:MAG: hypothetical protein AB4911_02060 [Oscillochloridaceae bacterium umkhey_bin13]
MARDPHVSPQRWRIPAPRLDQLWALAAVCMVAITLSLSVTEPNDYWWHLKAGELTATEGLPTTNRFAWTLPHDHPYTYQSWLGELLFFWLYQLGDHPLVIGVARNLSGSLAYALVAIEAQRRSGSWRWAAFVTVLAGLMAINTFTTRPQNWSWLPFMLTFTLLSRYVDRQLAPRWLILLPLLMALWVNLHGAFIMGILITGAFVVGESLRTLLRQPEALARHELGPLYLTLVAMGAALFVNPLGLGIFGYLQTLLTDQSSQQLVSEWQSPNPRDLAGATFYLSVLFVIAAFAFARRRPSITAVILVCGLAWQAFIGIRYVVWFGMVAMPIVAQVLGPGQNVSRAIMRQRGPNLVLAALLIGLVLLVQPWPFLKLPWPPAYREQFSPHIETPLLFSAATPFAAVDHLLAEPCPGRIFNEMGYGSYTAWALYPQARHFIDPRVELFPYELWREYITISRGDDLEAAVARHDLACIMLDRERQPGLAAAMPNLPGWQQSFSDGRSEVWRRNPDA